MNNISTESHLLYLTSPRSSLNLYKRQSTLKKPTYSTIQKQRSSISPFKKINLTKDSSIFHESNSLADALYKVGKPENRIKPLVRAMRPQSKRGKSEHSQARTAQQNQLRSKLATKPDVKEPKVILVNIAGDKVECADPKP